MELRPTFLPRGLAWRLALIFTFLFTAAVAETMPPAPKNHFNDYAGIVSQAAAQRLNDRLTQYERESSNQLLVAVYRRMESESSVEDFTVRIAQSWKVGQKDKSNGAVLFVFLENRQLYLQVGYGLEAVIPDATAQRIIDQELKPRFRAGDYEGGFTRAVDAMIAASRGEYKGSGQTQAERVRRSSGRGGVPVMFFMGFIVMVILVIGGVVARYGSTGGPVVIGNRRRQSNDWWNPPGGGGGFGGFGGRSSGGGGRFGGG